MCLTNILHQLIAAFDPFINSICYIRLLFIIFVLEHASTPVYPDFGTRGTLWQL